MLSKTAFSFEFLYPSATQDPASTILKDLCRLKLSPTAQKTSGDETYPWSRVNNPPLYATRLVLPSNNGVPPAEGPACPGSPSLLRFDPNQFILAHHTEGSKSSAGPQVSALSAITSSPPHRLTPRLKAAVAPQSPGTPSQSSSSAS